MPRFAANLGYLFTDRPLVARIDAAAACGFKAIELQFPYDVPVAEVKAAIERNKLTVLGINTLQGGEGEFGYAAVPGRQAEWRETFARALDYISTIGGSAVHCLAGRVAPEQRAEAERVYIDNLARAADLAAAKNIALLIEPINPRDRPGYFLNHVEHAADIIARINRPNVRMQFDFYHVQIVGGDLITRLERCLPVIGHLQCAAVPTRHEPDEGEINYPAVFAAVDRVGYTGWIGAEYRPRDRTENGLGWGASYGLHAPVQQ
ncbi:MAG TPA: TIM barrel protein [Pseudolabrys sp.]|nr:TIM barrel protein [Pseudolabrys sp.]